MLPLIHRIAALSLIAAGLVACDPTPSSNVSDGEHVLRAREYWDARNVRAASIELKNALSINPDNAEARWLLGTMYLEVAQGASAEKELTRALELNVARDAVVPSLAKALLLQKKFDELTGLDVQELRSPQARADVMASKALAFVMNKSDVARAQESIDAAEALTPKAPYILEAKAVIQLAKGETEAAEATLTSIVDLFPEYGAAWSHLAGIRRDRGEIQAAIDAYGKAIDGRLSNSADRYGRASLLLQLKDIEAVERDLEELRRGYPEDPRVKYLDGMIHFLREQYAQAQTSFEEASGNPDAPPLTRYFLAVANYMQGNLMQAEEYLGQFRSVQPNWIPARKLSALLKTRKGDYAGVEALLRPVVKVKPDDRFAGSILASALIKQGKFKDGVELLSTMAEIASDSAEAQMQLGVGLLQSGDERTATEHLQKALALDPSLHEADIVLIVHGVKSGRPEAAMAQAKAFRERSPDSPLPENMIGYVYLSQGDEAQAIDAFQRAKAIAPGDPGANSNLAEIALGKRQWDQAMAYYREILNRDQKNVRALTKLAEIEARQGRLDRAEDLLKEAVKANPELQEPRLALARFYLMSGGAKSALAVLSEKESQFGNDPEFLFLLGTARLEQGAAEQAKAAFERVVNTHPESVEATYLLARAHGELKDRGRQRRALEKVLELKPDHIFALLTYGRLLLLEGDQKGLAANTGRLAELAPTHPEVLWMQGIVAGSEGRPEQGIEYFRKAYASSPTRKYLLSLAKAQGITGHPEEAVATLEAWLETNRNDVAVMLNLADELRHLGRDAEAEALYARALGNQESIVALNNLAWMLMDEDPDQAYTYVNRALSAKPDHGFLLDTLAMILMKKGEFETALRYVERAANAMPDNLSVSYHRAQILEAAGDKREAIRQLETVLGKKKDFPEMDQAKAMLSRLSG